ncbi:MAG: type 4a pilus biogenesis protein PilO [Phycisphaerae bacterium]|nr:type 4a pilus biogenesis protein PilO [Phycisphaerae bacterium]
MIRSRRLRIYKLDLGAAALLVAAAAGAYFVAIRPEEDQARRGSEIAAKLNAAQTHVAATRAQLDGLVADIEKLRTLVDQRLDDAPEATQLNEIRSRIVSHAKDAGLDIKSILPQPTRPTGEYLTSDFQIEATGHLDGLITFLDTLGAEHPYHAVQAFSLTRDEISDDGLCDVSISLRLHMLPESHASAAGGRS